MASTNNLFAKIFGCEWLFGGDARVEDRPRQPQKPEKNVPCDYWLKNMAESGVYVPNRDITDKYELNVRIPTYFCIFVSSRRTHLEFCSSLAFCSSLQRKKEGTTSTGDSSGASNGDSSKSSE